MAASRGYGVIRPRFWTGKTAKKLRKAGHLAQLVAVYISTAPTATMSGLYYLPIPTIAHELGCSMEGASEALQRVCESGFASYDHDEEVVFVHNLAREQIGERLKTTDKRFKGLLRVLEEFIDTRLFPAFVELYAEAYNLRTDAAQEISEKVHRRAIEGPSEPHRSQEQRQRQDQHQRQRVPRAGARDDDDTPGPTERGREARRLAALQAELRNALIDEFGLDARRFSDGDLHHPKLVSEALSRGHSPAELEVALRACAAEARGLGHVRYLDGVRNWTDEQILRARAMTPAEAEADARRRVGAQRRDREPGHNRPSESEDYSLPPGTRTVVDGKIVVVGGAQ